MTKMDIARAQLAADLLSPPPEIVNAARLRDVVEYLYQKRGLRTSREILAAIRRFRWASPHVLQRAMDVPARVERMLADPKCDICGQPPPPPPPEPQRAAGKSADLRLALGALKRLQRQHLDPELARAVHHLTGALSRELTEEGKP